MGNWWDEAPVVDPKGPKPSGADPAWWSAATATPTTDEQIARAQASNFPTPGQTAMTMLGGAARAIPGMAIGAARMAMEAPVKPILEAYRMARGEMPKGYQAAQALVQGAQDLGTPAYKAATGRTGEITPEEMERAAGVGGGAAAALAVPFAPKGARAGGAAAGKVGITGANVVKVLKFTGEKAAQAATHPATGAAVGGLVGDLGGAALGVVGAPVLGRLIGTVLRGRAAKLIGDIPTDKALKAASSGDMTTAGQVIAKALEKNPAAADAAAADIAAAVETPIPVRPRMSAAERDRLMAQIIGPRPPGRAGTIPEPGNVKPATIFSNPRTPAGKPLTVAQRNAALEELQLRAAEEAGLDLADVFGLGGSN